MTSRLSCVMINKTTLCRIRSELFFVIRFEDDDMMLFVGVWGDVMNEQPENRRVRMTRRLLKDALLELLEERDLSNISVTAICETADVHRSTFYKYYTEPSQLLREIEEDYLNRIPGPSTVPDQQGRDHLLLSTTAFFDYVKENENVFRILFRKSGDNGFAARIVDLLCARHIIGVEEADETRARFIRLYIAKGSVGLMRAWLETDFPVSSREIAEMICSLTIKIIT